MGRSGERQSEKAKATAGGACGWTLIGGVFRCSGWRRETGNASLMGGCSGPFWWRRSGVTRWGQPGPRPTISVRRKSAWRDWTLQRGLDLENSAFWDAAQQSIARQRRQVNGLKRKVYST